jgi:iron complex transport system substrate-binding protein
VSCGPIPRRAAAGRLPAVLALTLCLPHAAAGTEVSVSDDSGSRVTLAAPATRVISLAPHLTELMFSIGAGRQLVATVDSADYPTEALVIPKVGDSASLDFERIVALRPDLVLAWRSGNGNAAVERLRGLGVPVFVSEPDSLARIQSTLTELGSLTGRTDDAGAAARRFAERLASLSKGGPRNAAPRVFYQIWGNPIFTVNGRHVISEIIDRCGGRNVFSHLPGLAGQVDVESVLAADPDVIVASGHDDARPPWLDDWKQWPQLSAVTTDRLYYIPPASLQRHTLRILDGAESMCRMLKDSHAQ